ncbi:LOW QUALITY PROTEIN: pentatricopeptide repeat-containing protein At5g15280, mitochondrial [Rhodamnia argentea]|uniref:LOW QUALITY PROTEIN: pentatricopeptide repeat-containing protein At5g15280, mitochondrial n=1 Tax=Rhodamnia argentea TaxID=178133 RepID=A0A8B8N2L7_9MYRT|nr:LOW QUALITY PROTEIN: pentatricopeptide repeat-containing protein At5g15280, mitochondrial [Rhodamnia argentea]
MLQRAALSRSHIKQLLPLFSLTNHRFAAVHTLADDAPRSPSPDDQSSSSFRGIAGSVLSRCAHLLEEKSPTKVKTRGDASLKDLLFEIFDVIPDTARGLLRASELEPQDVLRILSGFTSEFEKVEVGVEKVESLWEVFKFPMGRSEGFEHLPRAYELMGSMLTRVGLLREAELLLRDIESRGIPLDSQEIFSDLIERYAGVGDFERSLYLLDKMSSQGLVPARSCYYSLIELLVRRKKPHLALRVSLNLIDSGISFDAQQSKLWCCCQLLCEEGKIPEARNLVKKAAGCGYEPCSSVLFEIVCAYCEKRDFEDLLSFFLELNCAPDVQAGNRMISALCWNSGSERANLFRLELEQLGFKPDEITFGMLIGWCCREGNLKGALVYLSEVLGRGLKPDICSYNALISAIFKEGMWEHACHILDEMIEGCATPNFLTYKIFLAGYCKARKFDEVRTVVDRMMKLHLIQLSSTEDPLSKAFTMLGFGPLDVKLKRDSDARFSRTEFYDSLGNGLYLDADIDEFDKRINGILDDAFLPDFNSLIMKHCRHGNLKYGLRLVDEMVQWGQNLSLSVLSALVKGICTSYPTFKCIDCLLEKMPRSIIQLDADTLNLLAQLYSKRGWRQKARIILDGMQERGLVIENETYNIFIRSLSEKGFLRELSGCLDLVRESKWVPGLKDLSALVGCLSQNALISEALELFESSVMAFPAYNVVDVFLEKLCDAGLSTIAYALVKEMHQRGCLIEDTAYSQLIRGFCGEKKYLEALSIFDTMQAKRLVPHPDASVLLIPILCKAKRFTEAIGVNEAVPRDDSSLSLSSHCALLKGYLMAGELKEASNLFWDLSSKGVGPHAEACAIMVWGICQSNNLRKVEEVLAYMIRRNLSLSLSSFRMMVRLMCLGGQAHAVLNLKNLLLGPSNSHGLIVYNILIFYAFSSGNIFLVKKILDELQEKKLQPDEVTYNFLVDGFSKIKDLSSSLHYLSIMISKELAPSKRSLRSIITCSSELSDPGMCIWLSQELESRGWITHSTIQNAVVKGLLSHGKLGEAEKFVDRMVEKNLVPDGVIYDGLVKQLSRQGKMKKAVHLVNIMVKRRSIPTSSCYDSLACGFCRNDELQQALDVHAEMLSRDLRPSMQVWAGLIRKCCDVGETAEAEKLLVSMTRVGELPTREMYRLVINRYCCENNSEKASDLVRAMQRIGYEPDFDAQWSIISTLNKPGVKVDDKGNAGFLSRLLSGSGFASRK